MYKKIAKDNTGLNTCWELQKTDKQTDTETDR